MRPLIGVSCYVESASWGVWRDVRATLLPQAYVDHVHRAGGRAFVIPPLSSTSGVEESADETRQLLASLDGLIIAGGVDVEPARYGHPAHSSIQAARADRDASELGLACAAMAQDLPLLGICRGMQVLAVAVGGTLEQHLPDRLDSDRHAPAPGEYGWHPVTITAGTVLGGVLGTEVDVASYHHQAVNDHPGFVASAYAPDGVLEAIEHPDLSWCVGVQWHPEVTADNRIFTALVAASLAGSGRRRARQEP